LSGTAARRSSGAGRYALNETGGGVGNIQMT